MGMSQDSVGEITSLLQAAKSGQPGAVDRLFSLVYDELRKIAKNRISACGHWTSEPTTVVNEAYLRLFKKENPTWEDRHHFFWAAARAMRDILVERARRDRTISRGAGRKKVELHDDMATISEPPDLIDLNEALTKLGVEHPESFEIVMLYFFAGLTQDDIAKLLNVSRSKVCHEWLFARAWLLSEIDR
jgi:RNA polymerase sigma-70 factor, ECF subfamily